MNMVFSKLWGKNPKIIEEGEKSWSEYTHLLVSSDVKYALLSNGVFIFQSWTRQKGICVID